MVLGWQQIVWLVIIIINLGMHLAKHGEPTNSKYNFWAYLIGSVISLSILYSGGFFG